MAKGRLDILLVQRGYYPSREQARSAIMAGRVFVDGDRIDKAGTGVAFEAEIDIRGQDNPFVSRGGFKLLRAIEVFGLDLNGKTVLDAGASTGGFTDCALQAGANHVIAVDVGYGQLAWKLRNAINDPLFGFISDRTKSKLGRRIPYIRYGSPIIGIAFILSWLIIGGPDASQTVMFIQMTLLLFIFDALYTAIATSIYVMPFEMAVSNKARSSIFI
ncbi:MAG: MFS transporter, partial [Candidatus Desulforudis sp.]|nr:MFS transporter [Desulforudis sp.]